MSFGGSARPACIVDLETGAVVLGPGHGALEKRGLQGGDFWIDHFTGMARKLDEVGVSRGDHQAAGVLVELVQACKDALSDASRLRGDARAVLEVSFRHARGQAGRLRIVRTVCWRGADGAYVP